MKKAVRMKSQRRMIKRKDRFKMELRMKVNWMIRLEKGSKGLRRE